VERLDLRWALQFPICKSTGSILCLSSLSNKSSQECRQEAKHILTLIEFGLCPHFGWWQGHSLGFLGPPCPHSHIDGCALDLWFVEGWTLLAILCPPQIKLPSFIVYPYCFRHCALIVQLWPISPAFALWNKAIRDQGIQVGCPLISNRPMHSCVNIHKPCLPLWSMLSVLSCSIGYACRPFSITSATQIHQNIHFFTKFRSW
jgi:hypothetical protein